MTYSQCGQDVFVLAVLQNQTQGVFVDLGCAHPCHLNNTKLLEEQGWTGISIDIVDYAREWERRRTPFICADALDCDFQDLFERYNLPRFIDYLSIDLDKPGDRYRALRQAFQSGHAFKVITVEHDVYKGFDQSERKPQREFLKSKGYVLVCADVSAGNNIPFEDWWIQPKYVQPAQYGVFCSDNINFRKIFAKAGIDPRRYWRKPLAAPSSRPPESPPNLAAVTPDHGPRRAEPIPVDRQHDSLPETPVNPMHIADVDGNDFYLFLDIFVHGSGSKLTAVAPYYHTDIDWPQHGVDYHQVILTCDRLRVTGTYMPHCLDSWEPSIILDFEHPALEAYLRTHDAITFTVQVGPHEKTFTLPTSAPPAYDIVMSVIIRNENRWIGYYLDYYLQVMQVDHVLVYDNNTCDKAALLEILSPYHERHQVTYIPWPFRWYNTRPRKQIGQPPQQIHTLNRYHNSRWIGVFDVDEFLRIPGQTIPEFLRQYDANTVGGVSFGLRWFMYQGEATLDDIENPLLSMFHSKRDPLGRKRQKLFVSPQNVRFMRFHWLQEDAREVQVDDGDIFFHHYYVRPYRFDQGKQETGTVVDDYMRRFAGAFPSGRNHGLRRAKPPAKPQTPEDWVAHVVACFANAERGMSRLPDDILALEGMCGRLTRHFYNNLCHFEGCRYLEIGSWKGASLCAAMYQNQMTATSIDNWSQFGGPKDIFLKHINLYKGDCDLSIIEADCFQVDTRTLGPFNVYLYDGLHSAKAQYQALVSYYDTLEDQAVVIIDDWNWERVRHGTRRAMQALNIPIIFDKEILLDEDDLIDMPRHKGKDTWWNGLYVMVIDKHLKA